MLQLHRVVAQCILCKSLQTAEPGSPQCPHPQGCIRGLDHRPGKGAGDHVGISPERDTLPRGPASGPRSGNETSRRNPPQCAVTIQAAGLVLLACLCVGMLLGTTWTVQALQPKLRRQAEERRRLNAEWQAIQDAQQSVQSVWCPRCGCLLPARPRYITEGDEPDDD